MFDDLVAQLHALPIADKGRAFERLVRWYLENAPEYRSLIERVYPWSEWPGRWGGDAGIDLVAETRHGELWAIQAKACAERYSIKKADVDSFLSESNRPIFNFRLLIASTDGLGGRAARTLHEQEKPVGIKLLSQLRTEAIQWPESLVELKPQLFERFTPLPHQDRAIADAVDGFRDTDRGQLLMACGTGKTLASLWIGEALASVRSLVLVPSLSLLGQTLRVWTAQASTRFDYLAVCSDESVADNDNFTSSTTDLGVPVTTDADEIARFLVRPSGRRVIFATYQSSPVVAEALRHAGVPELDLTIADEAHRCTGPKAGPFATVLRPYEIRARRRLFMTATPRIMSLSVRKASAEREAEVSSMDDLEAFGPVFHKLSFRDAIEEDLLADYRVVVIGVDEAAVAHQVNQRELVTFDGEAVTDAATLARQVGLLRAIRRFDLRRVLTFHARVKGARHFVETLPGVADWMPASARPSGQLQSSFVSGAMSAGEREAILHELREVREGSRAVLANVRCLSEGVDVPTLDGIAFIDPRRSAVDIVQAVGRAIRRSESKTLGTVVIPVFISPGLDDEEALSSSSFDAVWQVVRALRAHDEVLGEWLDAARYRLGREGVMAQLPAKIVFDLPLAVGPAFARAFEARLVEQTTNSGEFWIGLLERYLERGGSILALERDHHENGHALGAWVQNQRNTYQRGEMSLARSRRLEAISGWVWDKQEERWEAMFRLLQQFIAREGHAVLPKGHYEDGEPLGRWLEFQSPGYRNRTRPVREDRVARLEAVGCIWDRRTLKWERGFVALHRYAFREGDVRVPTRHLEDGVLLRSFISRQRKDYETGRLERSFPERIRRLESLPGWSWRVRPLKVRGDPPDS